MDSTTWIFFSKTGTGYELKGSDVVSGFDAFINSDKTYMIEYAYSDIKESMHFFIYEWDNSQKKRRTIFEGLQREIVLLSFVKNVNVTHNMRLTLFEFLKCTSIKLSL